MRTTLLALVILLSSCNDHRGSAITARCAVGIRVGFATTDTIGPVYDYDQVGDTVSIHNGNWSYPTERNYVITGIFYRNYETQTH